MALEEGMVNGKIQKMLKNLNLKVCLEKKC